MTLPQAIAWRPASFRGAPFGVDDTERAGGRRGPVHQVPKRDDAAAEDMGLKAPEFSIKGFVWGDDYAAKRDRLIAALEAEGPGELVHPHYGTVLCKVDSYTCREESKKLGWADFTLKLIRVGNNSAMPIARTDTAAGLSQARGAARISVAEDFARVFTTRRQPDFVAGRAQSQVDRLYTLARWRNRTGQAAQLVQNPGTLAYRVIDNLSGGRFAYLAEGSSEAAGLGRNIGLLRHPGTRSADWLSGIRSALSWQSYRVRDTSSAGITWSTPARQQAATNDAALELLVHRAAMLSVATEMETVQPPSRRDAYEARPEIAAGFDRIAPTTDMVTPVNRANGSSSVYLDLNTLRASALTHLVELGGRAGESFALNLDAPASTLALANRLYGDDADAGRSRAADILARNPDQRDPAALRGRLELGADG